MRVWVHLGVTTPFSKYKPQYQTTNGKAKVGYGNPKHQIIQNWLNPCNLAPCIYMISCSASSISIEQAHTMDPGSTRRGAYMKGLFLIS